MGEDTYLTGAELHLYHVYLSQVLLALILNTLPDTFSHKEFLLSTDSLEKINAMISLTDIKADPKKYREKSRAYLDSQDPLIAGESLATSDLLTQLSTSDRLGKNLALYHEFFLGGDGKPWHSGLALIKTATSFYEYFAKKLFNIEVFSYLDKHFQSTPSLGNPYRAGLELNFFLSKPFEPIYEKLTSSKIISDQDILVLNGLHINGLKKEVVDLFLATQILRNNLLLPEDLKESLDNLLKNKKSILEISIGDEVRITLMIDAALRGNSEDIIELLSSLYKPELLVSRSFDFLTAIQKMKDHPKKEHLLEVANQLVKKIPLDSTGLTELENALTLITTSPSE